MHSLLHSAQSLFTGLLGSGPRPGTPLPPPPAVVQGEGGGPDDPAGLEERRALRVFLASAGATEWDDVRERAVAAAAPAAAEYARARGVECRLVDLRWGAAPEAWRSAAAAAAYVAELRDCRRRSAGLSLVLLLGGEPAPAVWPAGLRRVELEGLAARMPAATRREVRGRRRPGRGPACPRGRICARAGFGRADGHRERGGEKERKGGRGEREEYVCVR